jgi:NADH:ubiquinone oxidoreductase subunit 4 (subunit M)
VLYDRVHSRVASYGGVVNHHASLQPFACLLFAMANFLVRQALRVFFVGEWMVTLGRCEFNFWVWRLRP